MPAKSTPHAVPAFAALAVLGVAVSCKNAVEGHGGAGQEPTTGAAPPAASQAPGALTPSSPVGTVAAGASTGEPSGRSGFASAKAAAEAVCSESRGSARRKAALDFIATYPIATAPWDSKQAASGQEACVKALRLPALVASLASGVPVGTFIGQALQETGYCTSDLARQAYNFHGMKAHVAQSNFTYWTGAKFRKASTESTSGSGNLQVSDFMKFSHVDHGFWSLAERLVIPTLPYVSCFGQRSQVESFMRCIGKSWAVHTTYAEVVLGHRKKFGLEACELDSSEWRLKEKWSGR